MTRALILMVLVACGYFLPLAKGTSYAPPEDRTAQSPNGKFTLRIDPKSGRHRVYQGKKRLWSFQQEVWHDAFFLSNDGQRVMWLAWPYVQTEALNTPAMIIFSPSGIVLQRSYSEVSKPRRYRRGEIGPIGSFWRVWRDDASQDGDTVTVDVSGRKPIIVNLNSVKEEAEPGRRANSSP